MAQLGRPAILSKINTFITENTSGAITATQMNEILRDIADSCLNIDSDESLPPSLAGVLSQGNTTQGNNIILDTGDFIGNPDFPFFLGYNIDGDKNRMVMAGYDVDKAAFFFLKEELGEFESQMGFSDFNTGSDHSFRANINGLEMKSDNSDYSTEVYIDPSAYWSHVHSQINGANTSINQSPDSIYNYVNDPENTRSTRMHLRQAKGSLISEKFIGLDRYLANITVDPTEVVVFAGSHTYGGNLDSTEVTVKPESFQAKKSNHMLLVDPDFNSVGTGFYTADELDNIRSRMRINESYISFESSENLDNKYARAMISNTTPLIDLIAGMDGELINVLIGDGSVTFYAFDNGNTGQTVIDPLGVVTSGSYVLNEFGQGLGNSSSGFAVLWYDTPEYHTEPVMTIGSWNPETSTGIGMQISEFGLWSNLDSSLDGDQYFLADVYLQNSRVFADNAAAVAGGLPIGAMYHTTTGEVRVRV